MKDHRMSAVTKEDVARLHAYLVVPVAVGEALMTTGPLEGDVQYGLHVALSELDSDSALLAIALSAYRIAQEYAHDIPVAAALKMECEQVIQDYAPDWLAHYHNHPVQGDALYDLLANVPDDLESIADLLETLKASFNDEDEAVPALCAVLAIQARAHRDIADFVLSELDNEAASFADHDSADCRLFTESKIAPVFYTDNIILFPANRRR